MSMIPKILNHLRQQLADLLDLSINEVRPKTGFYQLGLNSRGMVQLLRQLQEQSGVRLQPSALFRHPTPQKLAEYLAHHHAEGFAKLDTAVKPTATQTDYPVLTPLKRTHRFTPADLAPSVGATEFPLSEGQKGLWALQRMAPDMSAYNVPLCFELSPPLDPAVVERACAVLVQQHPILTHVFTERDGHLTQAPNPGQPFGFLRKDLSNLSRDKVLQELKTQALQPMDLAAGPLFHVNLIQHGPDTQFLLCVVHHILFDGASYPTFIQALFNAIAGTQIPPSPALPFSRYVALEQERLNGPEGARRLAWWRERLASPPPVLKPPTDFSRAAVEPFAGESAVLVLPQALGQAVQRFAEAQQVYPAALFLTVYQLLLARYSGERDLIVGLVSNGRPDPGFAGTIGFFIDMLPIRATLTHDLSGSQWLDQVRSAVLDAMAEAVPFAALVRRLDIPYTPDQSPLFQVTFTYQDAVRNSDLQALNKDLPVTPRLVDELQQTGGYELGLEIFQENGRFHLLLKYNPSLYTGATAQRMLGHTARLLEGLITTPATSVLSLELLTHEERKLLIHTWNETAAEFPRDLPMIRLFEMQAKRLPQKTAVIFEDQSLTYAQLDQRANAVAAYLRAKGVGANTLVGICVDRSLEMVVGLLGIMKSGGAYVPLDPDYPQERLRHMIDDSGIKLVLTHERRRQTLTGIASSPLDITALDADWDQIQAAQAPDRPIHVDAEELAYVIYTSGSTGKPKGVMIHHRALTNFLVTMGNQPGLSEDDRMFAITTYCFDIAGLELYLPLIKGANLIVCSAERQKNVDKLLDRLKTVQPTVMQATPATWTMMFLAGWRNEQKMKILCGGEALPGTLKARFMEVGAEVWNMFGPTETTIWSTVSLLDSAAPITIGKPIANTYVYILDAAGAPTPINVAGELIIGGVGVARGYWNRPDLTQARFVDDPFNPGGKMYRTGDLARWLPNGTIDFLGRMDDQVKVRGYRIELGEIETRLNRHSAVREAVVVVHGEAENKRLVAYIVPQNSGADLNPAQLRDFLLETLPDYMTPAIYIPLDAIPQTPNGKHHRAALAMRPLLQEAKPKAFQPPSQIELQIQEIWRHLLQLQHVDPHGRFFEMGGTSITAVAVSERIRTTFNVPFDVTTLFQNPTVNAAALYIAQHTGTAMEPNTSPVAPVPGPTRQPIEKPAVTPDQSLAIVGMSCHFPGADGVDAFWDNLRDGVESGHWFDAASLQDLGVPDHIIRDPSFIPKQLGIKDKACFDADFFGISPRDAQLMDPQFRHLLQHAWRAVEDAGYNPADIPTTGVYVSASNNLYPSLNQTVGPPVLEKPESYVSWLLAQGGTIPTMISYRLGFTGPSLFLHTNCSSGLTGLNLACQSLLSGETDHALVGAATLGAATVAGYLHQPGLNFSSDGKLRPFDADADGMVAGEGVAVLLVKRAADAVAAGDPIYALLRGIAVNNDGGDKVGFYAPAASGQETVIRQALERARVEPGSVDYVEAHGTGTSLGDPIEFAAIRRVYGGEQRQQPVGIGSVKSNLGHLDTAAGLAGLIKVALSMTHGQLPPTLNYKSPNPKLNLDPAAFFVVDQLKSWPRSDHPRRAALSSFGIGGTNAHAVLEEAPARPVRTPENAPGLLLVPLSAKTPERLQAQAAQLSDFLRQPHAQPIELIDAAFTLQVGRVPMTHRAVFLVRDLDDLITRLDHLAQHGRTDAGDLQGSTAETTDRLLSPDDMARLVAQWAPAGEHHKIAKAWIHGYAVDWRLLWQTCRPRRIHLPGYAFAKDVHWPQPPAPTQVQTGEKPLHPLVHRNVSTLAQQRFLSRFTGREFFLADHVIEHHRILPGVAFLEMAHAALTMALEKNSAFLLKNVFWRRPIQVDEPAEIHISLEARGDDQITYRITSPAEDEDVLHHQGAAVLIDPRTAPQVDLDAVRALTGHHHIPGAELYRGQERGTFLHGPAFRGVSEVWVGEGHVLARLNLPHVVAETLAQFTAHPGLMDAGVQVALHYANGRLTPGAANQGYAVPFALEQLQIFGPCTHVMWAHVTPTPGGQTAHPKMNLDLCDAEGVVRVRMQGLAYRFLGNAPTVETGLLHLIPKSQPVHLSPASKTISAERHLLVLGFDKLPFDAAQRPFADLHLHHWSSADQTIDSDYQAYAVKLLTLLQTLRADKPAAAPVRIHLLVPSHGQGNLYAGLYGMLQTAALEFSGLEVGLIEQDPDHRHQDTLVAALATLGHVRLHVQSAEAVSWTEAQPVEPAAMPWREHGVYLITGGVGGLGLQFAREIAAQTQNVSLILTSRSQLTTAQSKALAAMARPGLELHHRRLDVTDQTAVTALIDQLKTTDSHRPHGPLSGVLHLAGLVRDSRIPKKTNADLRAVLAPKVTGTRALDLATRGLALDFFALFSSVSAFGSVGQADYAAANAWLDAYAAQRREGEEALGKTLVLHWPLWAEGGMTVDDATRQRLSQSGLTPMPTQAGLRAFYHGLAAPSNRHLILHGQPHKLRRRFLTTTPEPAPRAPVTATVQSHASRPALYARLKTMVAEGLKVDPAKIGGGDEFEKFGFDSISLTDFSNQLNQRYNLDLIPTVMFEYPTLDALTDFLLRDHGATLAPHFQAAPTPKPKVVAQPKAAPRLTPRTLTQQSAQPALEQREEAVAVIGMSGVFPMAEDIDALWQNLIEGRDCISEIPADRWDWRALHGDPHKEPGKTQNHWGGFAQSIGDFDPLFFGISPREARFMDPQQRLLMTHVWLAIEDAGYAAQSLAGKKIGMFIGTDNSSGYSALMAQSGTIESYSASSGVPSMGPNRMSYFLNFNGPSEPVETACSSSLVAIDHAVAAMNRHGCEAALAGGVHAIVNPAAHISFSRAGALAADGRCKTFSEDADGFVLSEGAGVLFLKKLSLAEADGDTIHGVILAAAVNHGGKASSLTAPNPAAQAQLLNAAYTRADIDPRTLGYIETHGTGTKLGDPAEVGGLKTAFAELYRRRGLTMPTQPHCGLGSIKSNMGHLVLAAGVAGVIKVLLQLKHQTLVRSLHCDRVNPYIKVDNSPFFLADQNRPWPAFTDEHGVVHPRRAGVSSFGIGGANAHVVLEEYRAATPAPTPQGPVLFVLSAADRNRLKAYAQKFLTLVQTKGDTLDLPALAYTLQVGRNAMAERLGAVVQSTAHLEQVLAAYLADQTGDYRTAHVNPNDDTKALPEDVDQWLTLGRLDKLLNLWLKGVAPDWTALYTTPPKRLSLPTYPFARKRFWIPTEILTAKPNAAAKVQQPGLLRGLNTSDLNGPRFRLTLAPDAFFLRDHRVNGAPMLPGVAYLEMATAAHQTLTHAEGHRPTRLENMVWSRPITVPDGAVEVDIRLYRAGDALAFEVHGAHDGPRHAEGRVSALPARTEHLDLGRLKQECNLAHRHGEACYAAFGSADFILGPSFRAMTQLHIGNGQVLARLELPEVIGETADAFMLHPALLDAALQASTGLFMTPGQTAMAKPALPFALESLEVYAPLVGPLWVHVRHADVQVAQDKTRKIHLDLCDETGRILARCRGFSFRVFQDQHRAETLLTVPEWTAKPAPAGAADVDRRQVLWLNPPQDAASDDTLQTLHPTVDAAQDPAGFYTQAAAWLLDWLKAFAAQTAPPQTLLQVAVSADEHTGLSGMLRTAAQELPALKTQLLVLPEVHDTRTLLDIAAQEAAARDSVIRRTAAARQVLATREIQPDQAAPPWRQDGVYLISGGLGGLGRIFAGEILERTTAAHVILIGRRRLSDAEVRQALNIDTARVTYRAVDIVDPSAVTALIQDILARHGRLNGVLHAAGLIRDARIAAKSGDDLADVFAPKVAGTVNLGQACADLNLDLFVLFSSLVAQTGNVGQADYAAANGFLDAFAATTRHRQTLAVNWPLWADGGMTVAPAMIQAMRHSGLSPLPTRAGLDAFYRALAAKTPTVAVLSGDVERLRTALQAPTQPAPRTQPQGDGDSQRAHIQAQLAAQLGRMLDLEPAELDPHTEFDRYGLESIMLTDFSNALNNELGLSLMPTVFFEHPTLAKLAAHLQTHHAAAFQAESPKPSSSTKPTDTQWAQRPKAQEATPPAATQTAVAVIGMAGRFPMADNLDQLWDNLAAGRDCISEIPSDRWDWRAVYGDPLKDGDRTNIKWGGFIDGVGDFDPRFFGISPKEAEQMDPNQRLLMTYTWLAVEDAGYAPGSLAGQDVGIFVGTADSGYSGLTAQAAGGIEGYSASHMAPSMGPNRMSFFLDLHGPSEPIETACSSSLVAIHRAVEAVNAGGCTAALAGGVNTVLTPGGHISYSKAQALSQSGRCKTFAADADGFAIAEGVAMLFLKPLTDAQRDRDPIYGVIRATAENHGGRANSLSSPNPVAQAALLERAWRKADLDPATLGYLELHGTGTKLGDPAEINGLKTAYHHLNQADAAPSPTCGLGSIKANIGHAVLAAGVAGVIKVLLQLKHQTLTDSLHGRPVNPFIQLEQTPFYIVDGARPWPKLRDAQGRELPRRAGVSSFGFSGVNAHVVIEEHQPTLTPRPAWTQGVLITLSAANPDRLRDRAADLLRHLQAEASSTDANALIQITARILRVDPTDLDADQPLSDYGMEPFQRNELYQHLQTTLYADLDPADLAQAETLADIAALLPSTPTTPPVDLRDLAYTLQIGRDAMAERLAFVAHDLEAVRAGLTHYLNPQKGTPTTLHSQNGTPTILHTGRVRSNQTPSTDHNLSQAVNDWHTGADLQALPAAWVAGHTPDWAGLYVDAVPQRLHLPTYPFPKTRYWLSPAQPQTGVATQLERLKRRLPHLTPPDLNPGPAQPTPTASRLDRLKRRLAPPAPPKLH